MRIILASQSPRRREILTLMGLKFDVIDSHCEENPPQGCASAELVCALARQKAEAVFAAHPDACVIGADTVVDLDGQILGKPHTAENARRYLSSMQGRTHTVYTGITLLKTGYADVRHCTTKVTFAPMTEGEIDRYVATGEPLDKAGAYGAQGPGGVFVRRIEGSYFNIIGMPMDMLYEMLTKAETWDGNQQWTHE